MRVYERTLCECRDPRVIISLTIDEARAFYREFNPRNDELRRLNQRLFRLVSKIDEKERP